VRPDDALPRPGHRLPAHPAIECHGWRGDLDGTSIRSIEIALLVVQAAQSERIGECLRNTPLRRTLRMTARIDSIVHSIRRRVGDVEQHSARHQPGRLNEATLIVNPAPGYIDDRARLRHDRAAGGEFYSPTIGREF